MLCSNVDKLLANLNQVLNPNRPIEQIYKTTDEINNGKLRKGKEKCFSREAPISEQPPRTPPPKFALKVERDSHPLPFDNALALPNDRDSQECDEEPEIGPSPLFEPPSCTETPATSISNVESHPESPTERKATDLRSFFTSPPGGLDEPDSEERIEGIGQETISRVETPRPKSSSAKNNTVSEKFEEEIHLNKDWNTIFAISESSARSNASEKVDASPHSSAIAMFNNLFTECDVESRFQKSTKHCLGNNRKGERCGSQRNLNGPEIRSLLVEMADTYDEDACINKLERLVELGTCWSFRKKIFPRLIKSLKYEIAMRDHGRSILCEAVKESDIPQSLDQKSIKKETTFSDTADDDQTQDVIPDREKKAIKNSVLTKKQTSISNPVHRSSRNVVKLSKFKPYRTPDTRAKPKHQYMEDILRKPLTKREETGGYIYSYWNEASFGYRKIGLTTKNVKKRLTEWEDLCGHPAKKQHRSLFSPHIHRVEKLIHADLADFRLCEEKCPGCSRKHREWFNVEPAGLIEKTIIKWTMWMQQRPYEEKNGKWQLKEEFNHEVSNMCAKWGRQELEICAKKQSSKQQRRQHEGDRERYDLRPSTIDRDNDQSQASGFTFGC